MGGDKFCIIRDMDCPFAKKLGHSTVCGIHNPEYTPICEDFPSYSREEMIREGVKYINYEIEKHSREIERYQKLKEEVSQ